MSSVCLHQVGLKTELTSGADGDIPSGRRCCPVSRLSRSSSRPTTSSSTLLLPSTLLLVETPSTVRLVPQSRARKDHHADINLAALLTVNISSPMNDVLKVTLEHHRGQLDKGPQFELFPDGKPTKPQSKVDTSNPDLVTFSSGSLSAAVNTTAHSYNIDFTDSANKINPFLCGVRRKGQAVVDAPYQNTIGQQSETSCLSTLHSAMPIADHASTGQRYAGGWVRFMMNEMTLSVGENIYGMGERFGPYIKNGQVVGMWNADGGTSSEQAYKNIPFYLSSRGYGVFVNHPEEVEFEVGREKCSRLGISVRGEKLEYFIFGGGSMKAVSPSPSTRTVLACRSRNPRRCPTMSASLASPPCLLRGHSVSTSRLHSPRPTTRRLSRPS